MKHRVIWIYHIAQNPYTGMFCRCSWLDSHASRPWIASRCLVCEPLTPGFR